MSTQISSLNQTTSTPSAARILVSSGLGLLFDSMDGGLIAFVLVVLEKQWSLGSTMAGLLGSMAFIGMAIGSALSGMFADRFGRRTIFLVTLLIYSIATGLTAFAPGIIIFLILRFIVGFGLGGELPVATTYVSESSPEPVRGRRVVYLETFWAGGSLVAAIISRLVIPSIGWRWVFLIGAIPALYTIVLRYALPETPKFRKVMNAASIKKAMATVWSQQYKKSNIATWILWFVMNFAYYGMFLWIPSILSLKGYSVVHSLGYVLIMTIAQIPGYLTAAWLVERWGRKRTLLTAMACAALSSIGFGFAASTLWLIIFGLLINYFMLAAFAGTYVFTVEQYPTRARASGFGWAAGFGRIGGIVAPLIVGSMIGSGVTFGNIFGMFFLIMLIGFFVVMGIGRETIGKNID